MKGFRRRAPLALWKVIMIVIASLIGIAGVTALVLFLTGKLDDKIVDPEDMAFTQIVDGQGYGDNINGENWYFLSDDSMITISCTTEEVTETSVSLSLRNGITRNGQITDGVITVPAQVELNKPFKVELVRRNGQVVGSVDGYSYISAKSQNILLPTKNAIVAVDSPVLGLDLAIGNGEVAESNEMQNVVVGSVFNINAIFTPESSKYLFNNKTTSKRVFYQVLGSDGVNYIRSVENADGSYTFFADEVSGNRYSTVNAYAFSNSYFEKIYFDTYPNATTNDIIEFLQAELQKEGAARQAVSASVNIKVLDIEVDEVRVEPTNDSLAEVYVDKYFTLSTNSTERPNDMSLGIQIFDSDRRPAQALLGRVGIKMPKGKAGFSILGGRVMKVTTTGEGQVIEELSFDPSFNYGGAGEGVEYYILPRTGTDYNNYYWSFESSETFDSFTLDINFFHRDQSGVWQTFFDGANEKHINVLAKDGANSVSITEDSVDMLINYDDDGNPIAAHLDLHADYGNSVYTRVAYFLYDNTRDAAGVNIEDVFACRSGVSYSRDYKGQSLNISGVTQRDSYMLYELIGNRLTVKKNYTGSVVVVAALVRTYADGTLAMDPNDATKYQIVCFSGAKIVNVESTLSISNMAPTFSFIEDPVQVGNNYYLPAINRNNDGTTKDMITFTLKLTSEDLAKDVEKLTSAYGKNLNVVCCDRDGNPYDEQYLSLSNFAEKSREDGVAIFEGTIDINEEFFTAGKNVVDQGRAVSLKLVYNDGKETREKLVGKDTVTTDGVVDYFYVYYQQPKELKATYQTRADINSSLPINVEISSGSNGLTIGWDRENLTASTYQDTIDALNNLLSFTVLDQFGEEIEAVDGIYSVYFTEVRNDSNFVLVFDEAGEFTRGIPTGIRNFNSTNGSKENTQLKVFVVDRKNANTRVKMVNEDGSISDIDMQSELLNFAISSEGLDYVSYDWTDIVGNSEDSRFKDAPANKTEISVAKTVKADDEIRLSDLFRIYTTNSGGNANIDYQITFDGTWLEDFKGNSGVELKKMMVINNEASESAKQSIAEYKDVPITTFRVNAPFGEEATLRFKIDSTNNLYSVTLNLVLSSDIEISRSFETYQTAYADYLTVSDEKGVSVFADEYYNLDEYLSFNNTEKYSWAKAFSNAQQNDVESNRNGLFYENKGIAKIDLQGGEVRLRIDAVRQYTPIEITLYYGVRSNYAFNTQIALYVNPNIVIEEKVSSIDENPLLYLTQVKDKNVEDYYSIWKATSYIGAIQGSETRQRVSLDGGTTYLTITDLKYKNSDNDGFLIIKNSSNELGNFGFNTEKTFEALSNYTQKFSISVSSDANTEIDAVKVKVAEDGARKSVTYSEQQRIALTFSVYYDATGIEGLVEKAFKGATLIHTDEGLRLLLSAGKNYEVDGLFNISSVTGNAIQKSMSNSTQIYTRREEVKFIDHNNSVQVYTVVADKPMNEETGATEGVKIRVNISIGVTVSNLGNEFVYYTNNDAQYNTFVKEDGTIVGFDKLVNEIPASLEDEGVYETLIAGRSYKILHDIATEYSRTNDKTLVAGKTYYINKTGAYQVVDNPQLEEISSYFEKNAPEAGFYYDSRQFSDGVERTFFVEVVSTANKYIKDLAYYNEADKKLYINSLKENLEGYILLKLTVNKREGQSEYSYSWYYRIKVEPNFKIGKVYYPYNDSDGEYLDTKSHYYNADTLTYTIDLSEKFSSSNSGRVAGYRFDDITWLTAPEGEVITPEFKLAYLSSNAATVTFDGSNVSITYRNASDVGTAVTVTIVKYWSVDGKKVVGSEMEYTFKLSQAQTYETELYHDEVKDANKVGPKNSSVYNATIVAGSEEQVFIPTVKLTDGNVTAEMVDFGASIKGDFINLINTLQFKKMWIAKGAVLTIVANASDELPEGLATTSNLEEDKVLVDEKSWGYADLVTTTTGETISQRLDVKFEGKETVSYEISDGKLWYTTEAGKVGVKLEDLIVEFMDYGLMQYYKTSDKTRNASKTYYVLSEGEFTEEKFAEGAGFVDEKVYYEKYPTAYKTVLLKPKANITQDCDFEMGVYTSDGIVYKVNFKAKSYFEWQLDTRRFASGSKHTFKEFISSLTTKDEGREITDINVALSNGADSYREYYFVTGDESRKTSKTYYTLQNSTYEEVKFANAAAEFDKGTIYYEKVSLTLADVVELERIIEEVEGEETVSNKITDLAKITLEVAPLVKDVTLDFDVTITSTKDGETSLYTFQIKLEVTKNFDESTNRLVQDMEWRYGSTQFVVWVDNGAEDAVASVIGPKQSAGSPQATTVSLISTKNTKYRFANSEGYTILTEKVTDPGTEIGITPENVAEETHGVLKVLKVVSTFKGKEIARFNVTYRFSVAKNVIVKENYPNPDQAKENTGNMEYISAMNENGNAGQREVSLTNFFAESATFADGARIAATPAKRNADGSYSALTESTLAMKWEVEVADISNLELACSTSEDSTAQIIRSDSTEKTIKDFDTMRKGDYVFKFTLLNTGAVGTITFAIRVNGVLAHYSVTVVNNPIVRVETNTPNYNNNREMIYAEDLAKSEEQTIFAENRLLNYTFKGSAVLNNTYYVRIANKDSLTEAKIVPITVTQGGVTINTDLGKSYANYKYVATYRTLSGAQTGNSGEIANDEDIYAVAPNLTSRIVVKYYDGRTIKLDASNYIQLGIETTFKGSIENDFNITSIGEQAEQHEQLRVLSRAKLVQEAGPIATFNGEGGPITYEKVNADEAYVGYFSGIKNANDSSDTNVYSGVILISKLQQGIAINRLSGGYTKNINGEVYWITSFPPRNAPIENYLVKGDLEDESELGKAIKLEGTTWNEVCLDFLAKTFGVYKKTSEVVLATSDYHNTKTFDIAVQVGDETIATNSQYSVYLEVEFAVSDNADSATSYSTKTINAGQELSLFDEIDFGIYNSRTGHKYSSSGAANTDNLKDAGGSVDLKIYGLEGLRITQAGDALQKVASDIHNSLRTAKTDEDDEIVYETGLTPRAGASALTQVNSFGLVNSGSINENYITYSDKVVEGKKVDFFIRAQGASNDGNHVMLRISYTVSFGNNTDSIVITHNLLFKVLPNADIRFQTRKDSPATTASANEVINHRSVASNKENPYMLPNNDAFNGTDHEGYANEIRLWTRNVSNGSISDNLTDSAIQAYLYGNRRLNNANTFNYSYTYKNSATAEYNSFAEGSDGNGINYGSRGVTGEEQFYFVRLQSLILGSKKFYVDAVDGFGFTLRFYFTLTASENPQIDSMSTNVLQEGQEVVVGAKYTPVAPASIDLGTVEHPERYQLLGTIENYVRKGGATTGTDYADIVANVPSQVDKIYLSAQTKTVTKTFADGKTYSADFGTVVRKLTDISDGEFGIWSNSDHVDLNENTTGWMFTNGSIAEMKVPDGTYGTNGVANTKQFNFRENQAYLLNSTISIYGHFSDSADFVTFTNLIYKEALPKEAGAAADDSYQDLELKQEYSPASTGITPSLEVGDDMNAGKALVTLRGVSAYAFQSSGNESIKALNTDVATDYISRVNDIKVEKIEYFLGDKSLGEAKRGPNTPTNPVQLVTSGKYAFYDGNLYCDTYQLTKDAKVIAGKTYYQDGSSGRTVTINDNNKGSSPKENNWYEKVRSKQNGSYRKAKEIETAFDASQKYYTNDKVLLFFATDRYTLVKNPNQNDWNNDKYYVFVRAEGTTEGANESVVAPGKAYANDADFIVPVIDSIYFGTGDTLSNVTMRITLREGDNTHTVERLVSITKLATQTMGGSLVDGQSIPYEGADNYLINDTLEVVLDPGASVSFAISDNKNVFTMIPSEGVITLTNNNSFTVTEYVGISASIRDMEHNWESELWHNYDWRNKFGILLIDSTGDYEFRYNSQLIANSKGETLTGINQGQRYKYQETRDISIVKDKTYWYFDEKAVSGSGWTPLSGSDFFIHMQGSDTIDSKIQYFTLTDGVYVPVANPLQTYIGDYYTQKKDKFYKNPNALDEELIPITYYEKSYKLTEDKVKVNDKDYFTYEGNGVYKKVEDLDFKLENIGTYYEAVVGDYIYGIDIDFYTGTQQITLNINDASEIPAAGGCVTRTLYFLYRGTSDENIKGVSGLTNTDRYYQIVARYNVYPRFEKITSTEIDTSGNIEYAIDNYYKVTKATPSTVDPDSYYIIPKRYWGKEITLNPYLGTGTSTMSEYNGGYQFTYEINTSGAGGAGGAFIDEAGTIYTAKNFNIQESTITVNVYMKVSGQNLAFNVNSTRLKLGQFRLKLNPPLNDGKKVSEYTEDKSSIDGTISTYYTKFYEHNAYQQNLSVTYISQEYKLYRIGTDETSTVIDEQLQLNKTPDKPIACQVGDTLDLREIFKEEGDEDKFVTYHILRDDVQEVSSNPIYFNNLNTYKVETEGTHTIQIVKTSVIRDTSVGSDLNPYYTESKVITLEVLAYNDTNRTDKVQMVYANNFVKTTPTEEAGTYYIPIGNGEYVAEIGHNLTAEQMENCFVLDETQTSPNYIKLGTGTWYELASDGTITEIKELVNIKGNKNTEDGELKYSAILAPGETGIYHKTFITKDEKGNTMTYSYTFYVVKGGNNDQKNEEVVLNQGGSYALSNLYSGYTFYKVLGNFDHNSDHSDVSNTIKEVRSESFSNSANQFVQGHYIVKDESGVYWMLTVKYKFTSSNSPVQESLFMEYGTVLYNENDQTGAIADIVQAKLEQQTKKKITIQNVQLIETGNVLKAEDGKAESSTGIISNKQYLITYTVEGSTTEMYYKYNPTIYLHDGEKSMTIYTQADNNYDLFNASGEILTQLGFADKQEAKVLTFKKFNSSGALTNETRLALGQIDSDDVQETYLVTVSYKDEKGEAVTESYLINFTFSAYSVEKTLNIEVMLGDGKEITLSELNPHVQAALKGEGEIQSISYYSSDANGTLCSCETLTLTDNKVESKKTYIAKVGYKDASTGKTNFKFYTVNCTFSPFNSMGSMVLEAPVNNAGSVQLSDFDSLYANEENGTLKNVTYYIEQNGVLQIVTTDTFGENADMDVLSSFFVKVDFEKETTVDGETTVTPITMYYRVSLKYVIYRLENEKKVFTFSTPAGNTLDACKEQLRESLGNDIEITLYENDPDTFNSKTELKEKTGESTAGQPLLARVVFTNAEGAQKTKFYAVMMAKYMQIGHNNVSDGKVYELKDIFGNSIKGMLTEDDTINKITYYIVNGENYNNTTAEGLIVRYLGDEDSRTYSYLAKVEYKKKLASGETESATTYFLTKFVCTKPTT